MFDTRIRIVEIRARVESAPGSNVSEYNLSAGAKRDIEFLLNETERLESLLKDKQDDETNRSRHYEQDQSICKAV